MQQPTAQDLGHTRSYDLLPTTRCKGVDISQLPLAVHMVVRRLGPLNRRQNGFMPEVRACERGLRHGHSCFEAYGRQKAAPPYSLGLAILNRMKQTHLWDAFLEPYQSTEERLTQTSRPYVLEDLGAAPGFDDNRRLSTSSLGIFVRSPNKRIALSHLAGGSCFVKMSAA